MTNHNFTSRSSSSGPSPVSIEDGMRTKRGAQRMNKTQRWWEGGGGVQLDKGVLVRNIGECGTGKSGTETKECRLFTHGSGTLFW